MPIEEKNSREESGQGQGVGTDETGAFPPVVNIRNGLSGQDLYSIIELEF
jgi:hypothetical protein